MDDITLRERARAIQLLLNLGPDRSEKALETLVMALRGIEEAVKERCAAVLDGHATQHRKYAENFKAHSLAMSELQKIRAEECDEAATTIRALNIRT